MANIEEQMTKNLYIREQLHSLLMEEDIDMFEHLN
jgi:hypothetical protein